MAESAEVFGNDGVVRWWFEVFEDFADEFDGDNWYGFDRVDEDDPDLPGWWRNVWPRTIVLRGKRELGGRVCKRCGVIDVLDPLRHCTRCRIVLGRCVWCGLVPIVYRRQQACRTCYRWLHRNGRTMSVGAASRKLLENARARHTQHRKS